MREERICVVDKKISTGRKKELTTAEQMDVKMKNRLPAVAIRVDDNAVAVVREAFRAGDFRRR